MCPCGCVRCLTASPPLPPLLPSCSDAANSHPASRLSQLQAESPQASKFFGNVGLPAEAESAAAAASEAAAAHQGPAAAADALENSAIGRAFSAIGNALFLGGVGAAAFFGYYTYRYDTDQVAHMVEETRREEANKFLGSKVGLRLGAKRSNPDVQPQKRGCALWLGCVQESGRERWLARQGRVLGQRSIDW